MEYIVRLREVFIHEICIESDTAKGAFLTAIKKAHRKKLNNTSLIGRFIELDHVTKGKQDVLFTKTKSYDGHSKPKKRK